MMTDKQTDKTLKKDHTKAVQRVDIIKNMLGCQYDWEVRGRFNINESTLSRWKKDEMPPYVRTILTALLMYYDCASNAQRFKVQSDLEQVCLHRSP